MTASLLEWTLIIVGLALVVSPFFLIRIKALQPTKWRHIALAYLASFAVFLGVEWVIDTSVKVFQNWKLINSLDDSTVYITFGSLIVWSLLIFYSTKVIYKIFTFKNLMFSIVGAILIFGVLIFITFWIVVIGLGQVGAHYL